MLHLLLALAVGPYVPPRLDALGDPLPDGALFRVGTQRWRAMSPFGPIAYAPGGRWIAVGDLRETVVLLFDARTGKRVSFPLPRGVVGELCRILRLCFSPDGTTLYASNDGKLACAFDVPSGRVVRTFGPPSGIVSQLAVSADGKELITAGWTGTGYAVICWSTRDGKPLRRFELTESDSFPTLSPRGDRFAYLTGEPPKRTFRVVATRSGKTLTEHKDRGEWAILEALSPDGRTAICLGKERWYQAVDVATGRTLHRFDTVWPPTFSPDSRTILGYSKDRVQMLDARTGESRPRLRALDHCPEFAAALSDDGRTLALVGGDLLRLVDTRTGKQLTPGDPDARISELAISPDGSTLLLGSTGATLPTVRIADGRPGRSFTARPASYGRLVTFSPDGTRVAAENGPTRLSVWDRATGKVVADLAAPEEIFPRRSLAFSPDGRTLYAAPAGATVLRWDIGTARALPPIGLPLPLRSAVPSADRRHLLLTDARPRLSTLDLASGEVRGLWLLAGERVTLTPLPGGKEVAVSLPTGEVAVRDLTTGKTRLSWNAGRYLYWTAVSPDGKLLAHADTGYIGLFELDTGRERRPVRADPLGVERVAFTPDGRRLVTAGGPSAMVWDVAVLTRTACRLPSDTWLAAWDRLGEEGGYPEVNPSVELHAALEQTLDEMPSRIVHDATPENSRRAAAGRDLLRRIGTPAARRLLERLAESPPDSPWAGRRSP